MKKYSFYLLLLYMFSITSCLSDKKVEEKEIKIGAILPITGKYADVGNSVKSGLLLALEQIKIQDKNDNLSILIEDAMSDVNTAISSYKKLVYTNKVKIIITTTSSICLAIKPMAIKDSVLLFCIASHPELTSNNNGLIFRPCNTSEEEGNEIIKEIKSKNDISKEKIWILYHNSEFGLAFKNKLSKDLDSSIIGSTSYDDNPSSFRDIISSIKSKKPTILITVGFTPSLGLLIKTIREQEMSQVIYSNIGFSSPSCINAAGKAAMGVKYVNYNFPDELDYFKNLDTKSMEQFKTGFGPMSFLSFFTINIIKNAIHKSNSDDKYSIANYIISQKNIEINGIKMNIGNNGNILPNLYIEEYLD